MNLDQLQSILAAEIECSVFERHVLPALAIAREVLATPAAVAQVVDAREPQDKSLPDPFGCLKCTHADCGRFEDAGRWMCRAMKDNACARPEVTQALERCDAALTARSSEPVAVEAAVRYIVIGYGEKEHPQATFVNERELLLDAVLGMLYGKPEDADAEVREVYRKDLEDDDEWSYDGIWRAEFEIGGVVIYDTGEIVKNIAPAAAAQVVDAREAFECLQDVTTHYGAFVDALTKAKAAASTKCDREYWQHEMNALARMNRQANAALTARSSEPVVVEVKPTLQQISDYLNTLDAIQREVAEREARALRASDTATGTGSWVNTPPVMPWERCNAAAGERFLKICSEELTRSSITSLPLKAEFATERGMTLDQVDEWMRETRRMFRAAVSSTIGNKAPPVCTHPASEPKALTLTDAQREVIKTSADIAHRVLYAGGDNGGELSDMGLRRSLSASRDALRALLSEQRHK